MDRLTSMAVFVKTVELGSFSAAAAALDLSGPMVGKHVQSLEDRLGTRLLNRTTRRQSLTEFGRTYYEHCRAILNDVEAAEALAADQASEPRGRLRVTMPVHFGRRCVAPILLDLARQYSALELDLAFSDRLADLADGEYDLALRTGDLEDRAGIISRRVARQQMVVCASPSYLETHGRPEQVEDLNKHEALVYRRAGIVAPWLFPRSDLPTIRFTPPYRFRFDDLDAIADAATAAMGIAWLPYWLVRDRIDDGSLTPVLSREPGFLYDCYALWLQTPHMPRKVRIAIDLIASTLPKLMSAPSP
ncbi:LysR family transcriptional regulator [Rhizobium binae]|uniref:LysR family transcriptional regulator n=1 Tax=Rhizobium binae TaxID=1138190 RepID=UPI001C830FAA|nr:LysR family transcriptional regulator [Rhizobium binae]MBX4929811.1 LysR family transcriptional regulator [Rhizobium binae]